MGPGHNARAGKRPGGRTRKGSPWFRAALVAAAHAAGRPKTPYPGAPYRRLQARRGPKRAAGAVAHAIRVSVSSILRRHAP